MAVVRCPHCQVALLEDEGRSGSCPDCGNSLTAAPIRTTTLTERKAVTNGEPRSKPTAPVHDEAPDQDRLSWWKEPWVMVCGVLLLTLLWAGIFWLYGLWAPDEPLTASGQGAFLVVQPKKEEGEVKRIELPDSELPLGPIVGGAKLKVRGRVKTLKVGLVDGSSTLDASELEAREILVTEKIDGHSTVKLKSPAGKVELHGKVSGTSRLEVNAPGGTVTFLAPPGQAGQIDKDAQVAITAREVDFRNSLGGTETHVSVTLTPGGTLKFAKVTGTVHLDVNAAP